MDIEHDQEMLGDLSALAWVNDELRATLEGVHKTLRRSLRDGNVRNEVDPDSGAVTPAALLQARRMLHQCVGVLNMIGLQSCGRLLQAGERALQHLGTAENGPVTAEHVELIEQGSFGLLDYLRRLLAGRTVQPLALFPQYQRLQQLSGNERCHPADLLPPLAEGAPVAEGMPPPPVAPLQPDARARAAVEDLSLSALRGLHEANRRLSLLYAALQTGAAADSPLQALWQAAAGFYEALTARRIESDLYTKRATSHLLATLRQVEKGREPQTDALLQELLFFCGRALFGGGDARRLPRLHAVAARYGLDPIEDFDAEHSPLGRFDPAKLPMARRRVATMKETWSAFCGGEVALGAQLDEQAALVADSIEQLNPQNARLSKSLRLAIQQVVASGQVPDATLGLEIATALLCLDASLDEPDLDTAELENRLHALAGRIDNVLAGGQPAPIEAWMEALYREVSERQTIGSVVHELRSALAETEQHLDQFDRNPADVAQLVAVPTQLNAMRGVLSVLGLSQAAQAVVRMRDDVDTLMNPRPGDAPSVAQIASSRLAENLGGLSFLIDMLGAQPQLARSLFRFDSQSGRFTAVMGQARVMPVAAPVAPAVEPAPTTDHVGSAADDAEPTVMLGLEPASPVDEVDISLDAAPAGDGLDAATVVDLPLPEATADIDLPIAAEAVDVADVDLTTLTAPSAPAPSGPAGASLDVNLKPPAPPEVEDAAEVDEEMREIFLEEAGEVLTEAGQALDDLRHQADDLSAITSIRRSFHTLKGSSRMVGLNRYGEAAWAWEQLFNARLAEAAVVADADLVAGTAIGLQGFGVWTEALMRGEQAPVELARTLAERAQALRARVAYPGDNADAAAAGAGDVDMDVVVHEDFTESRADAALRLIATPPISPLAQSAGVPLPSLDLDDDGAAPDTIDTVPEEVVPALDLRTDADLDASHEPAAEAPAPMDGEGFDLDFPPAVDEATSAADVAEASGPTVPALELPTLSEEHPPVAETVATDDEQGFHPWDDAEQASASAAEPAVEPSADLTAIAPDRMPPGDGEPVVVMDFELDLAVTPVDARTPSPDVADGADADVPALELPALDETADVGIDAGTPLPESGDVDLADLVADAAADETSPAEPMAVDADALPALSSDEDGVSVNDESSSDGREVPPVPVGETDDALPDIAAEVAMAGEELAQAEAGGENADVEPADADIASGSDEDSAEHYKLVGALRVPIALFNIYLNESDEQSRALCMQLGEWQHSPTGPVAESVVALAHSLAGNSATVGYDDLSRLSRRLEHALERSRSRERWHAEEAQLYVDAAEEVRRLLHQFAAGILKPVPAELLDRFDHLDDLDHFGQTMPHGVDGGPMSEIGDSTWVDTPTVFTALEQNEAPLGAVRFSSLEERETPAALTPPVSVAEDSSLHALLGDIDVTDAPDPELLAIFVEEAEELLPKLERHLRAWEAAPSAKAEAVAAMGTLHTLKGGARLAGAMRFGEMSHRLESALEVVNVRGDADASTIADLLAAVDALVTEYDKLAKGEIGGSHAADASQDMLEHLAAAARPRVAEPAVLQAEAPTVEQLPGLTSDAGDASADAHVSAQRLPEPSAAAHPGPAVEIDWSRFDDVAAQRGVVAPEVQGQSFVRVRSQLLDRLIGHAGEVGISRARIQSDAHQLQMGMRELTDNLERLRRQLRDLELQAESQMASRIEAARQSLQSFDPLEMDRFTRVQELTRMLAESVNDVGTLQRGLQVTLQSTEDQLAAQARLSRAMQDDLQRARMLQFDTLADRLYRAVRQASKDSGKTVRLDVQGGQIEIDRGVLDKVSPALEHLLRNAVAHGVESAEVRRTAGKDPVGSIVVGVQQHGNEVLIEVRDDGGGLDLARIEQRARATGMLAVDRHATEAELAALIFTPGFTTAEEVTELAGRGIGMDVVRSEVVAMGGRIETSTAAGRGTAFQLVVPLTTAVTQVVLLESGGLRVAVPAMLIERVTRVPVEDIGQAYAQGRLRIADRELPFFWLASLLEGGLVGAVGGRSESVAVVRSADQRIALHVGQVLTTQDVVVRPLGPQLTRVPGLTGMSLLPSGEMVLIYNPVALAATYGGSVRQQLSRQVASNAGAALPAAPEAVVEAAAERPPLVLVVDDSLTVRRVTQRLLLREGYRVELAKDGLDALEKLAAERPALMLSDIEMPRMDGFDLVRNVRADARLADLPVVMITSRIAQKHRDHAAELGVDAYLGKPYDEATLLALIERLARAATMPEAADAATGV